MAFLSKPNVNIKALSISAILAIIAGMFFLKPYFALIALAAILAYLMNPTYHKFLKKTHNKTGRSLTLTLIVLIVVITIPLTALIYITIDQAVALIDELKTLSASEDSLSAAIQSAVDATNSTISLLPGAPDNALDTTQVFEWIKNSLTSILSYSISFVSSLAGGVAAFFTNAIIFIFVFNSLLRNQDTIVSLLRDINPLGKKANDTYMSKMGSMTSAMVKGQFVIAIFQGFSGAVSLWIVGFDYLAFWFVILSFLCLIPLGSGIILIPMGILMILFGNVWQGLLILGFHFIVTTNIDNILRPKFVPKDARLDPALTILSVFSGIAMFGFLGIVLGPVLMIVIVTTISMYATYRRSRKLPSTIEA